MKAVLIDDENPALLHLERLLKADGRIDCLARYTSAGAALAASELEQADVVFLDIGMPEMNGLEAAEYIQQKNKGIEIVFATAYAEYAVEAFELEALDYLLKPISPARLGKSIDRMLASRKSRPQPSKEQQTDPPRIRCFKRLEVEVGTGTAAAPIRTLKWRTLKSRELFAYLLHHQEAWVHKEVLLEELWPRLTVDKALTHLHTSVYQIRKMLKDADPAMALEYSLDRYRLLRPGIKTDAECFETQTNLRARLNQDNYGGAKQVAALYRGDYYEEQDYSWAQAAQRRLYERYFSLILRLSQYELRQELPDYRAILDRLKELGEREPYSEEICQLMLETLAGLKDFAGMEHYYDSYTRLIREELGVEPGPYIRECYLRYMVN